MAIISHKLIKSGQSFPFFLALFLFSSPPPPVRNPTVQVSRDLSVQGYHTLFKPIILDYLQGRNRVCMFSLNLSQTCFFPITISHFSLSRGPYYAH